DFESAASADWARGPRPGGASRLVCGEATTGMFSCVRVYQTQRSSAPFLPPDFLPFSGAAAAAAAASALEGEGSSSGSYARNEPTPLRRASFSPFSTRYVSVVTRIRAVTRLVRRS